ncbi:MAG TPA: response regulator [Acidimicrobiales bacterium]|nr:response regulator [Acidimicrobiales bacterium]
MPLPAHGSFPCASSSAGEVREFVVAAVEGLDVDVDALKLCVSELVTNAVRHASTPFEVAVSSTAAGVRVEVVDGSPHPPVVGTPTGSGGFGLGIIDTLAHTWGFLPRAEGKVVWCELVPAEVLAPFDGPTPGVVGAEAGATYTISGASRILGVDAVTLRAWEHVYGGIVPRRDPAGQRTYTRDEIDELRFVVARMAEGASAGDAHRQLAERAGSVTFVPPASDVSLLVLLADRDPHAARLAEFFLRTEGYEVRVALDLDDARKISRDDRPPGVAIVELLLGGGTGLELCRELAAASIPVLAVSSLAMRSVALAAGASAFVAKPIDPLTLVSTVRDLVGTSALSRSSTSVERRDRSPR